MPLLHELPSIVKKHKRVGRGTASGQGTTAGRGTKGQKARAGWHRKSGFEGGQTPLYMRLPKGRGAKQRFGSRAHKLTAITVQQLNAVAATVPSGIVGPGQLRSLGMLGSREERVKLIGSGRISRKVTVRVHAATVAARQTVEAAGGTVEIIRGGRVHSVEV